MDRLKVLVAALAVCGAAIAVAQDRARHGVIEATEFRLVDAAGTVVGRWFVGPSGDPTLESVQVPPTRRTASETGTPPASGTEKFAPLGVIPSNGDVTAKYREVTDISIAETAEVTVGSLSVSAWYGCSGKLLSCADGQISIAVRSSESSWRWLRYHAVSVLLGADRSRPEARHSGNVSERGGVNETVLFKLSLADARRVASGERFRFSVGTDEVEPGPVFATRVLALLNTIGARVRTEAELAADRAEAFRREREALAPRAREFSWRRFTEQNSRGIQEFHVADHYITVKVEEPAIGEFTLVAQSGRDTLAALSREAKTNEVTFRANGSVKLTIVSRTGRSIVTVAGAE